MRKIIYKLLWWTILFFTIFAFISITFQRYSFGSFYLSSKKQEVKYNFNQLVLTLDENPSSSIYELFSNHISIYEVTNSSTIFVFDKNTGDGFTTNNVLQKPYPTIPNLNAEGDIEFYRYLIDSNFLSEKEYNDITSSGQIRELNYSTKETNLNYYGLLYTFENKLNQYVIFSITNLKPITEASEFFSYSSIYMLLFSLVLAVILAYIFSKIVSIPLVKLNEGANILAKLNFDAPIVLKTGDEFESVADNLNLLATKLDSSLKELSEKNIKLKEDLDLKEKMERIRKDFVAGVSHELKTPLSIISAYTEGLIDEIPSKDDIPMYYNVILEESQKMDSLIHEMLDLAALESSNFKLSITSFDIVSFSKNLFEIFKYTHQDIEFIFESDKEEIEIQGDLTRIEQVFKNLLSNAIKNTKPGNKIRLKIISQSENCLIKIFNEGENIPKDELLNIWDRFYKLDKSRNRLKGGTGLGLSITHAILTSHSSTFGIRNVKNGVEFYFTLLNSHFFNDATPLDS